MSSKITPAFSKLLETIEGFKSKESMSKKDEEEFSSLYLKSSPKEQKLLIMALKETNIKAA